MTKPAAGWYPDPQEPVCLRYWDGSSWTAHRSASPHQRGAPRPAYPHGPQPGVANPSNMLSTIGIVCGGLAFLFLPVLLGPAGLILGGLGMQRREKLAPVAVAVSAAGLVVGMVLGVIFARF